MEAYPTNYVDHNLPLVLLSGLGSDLEDSKQPLPPSSSTSDDKEAAPISILQQNGIKIFSDFPPLTDDTANTLLNALLAEDASTAPWNARNYTGKPRGIAFKIQRAGRTYTLPPHKAAVPPASIEQTGNASNGLITPLILHSPLSPLSPASPTFPDGMLTPLWVMKHQSIIPAAFVNFFPLTVDFNMASLRDNQLKIEINSLKKDWAISGYKSRFVVGLIFEDGPLPEDANERISSIRRATNLEAKNVFVLPPNPTSFDIREFVKSLLTSLQGPSVEYYRELSKHARRKRSRSTIPPPTCPPTTGTSQTLSLQGWNVRYEFKLGVFAEFRQEMDAACRSYESAYEFLFGEEVFGSIVSWSPRFNDARMLADALAIRIIRCRLWIEQTTAAVKIWETHRKRIRDIVGYRGKGTNTYGWEAWEGRWSFLMAQLIERADLSVFESPGLQSNSISGSHSLVYAMPEKAIPVGERLYPWELLHHRGYWLRRAAKHTARRRLLASKIPEEDRIVPDESHERQKKTRSNVYDTYLAAEPYIEYPISDHPGANHSRLIIKFLEGSIAEFSRRDQTRAIENQKLEMAKELMQLGSWTNAFQVLRPLWPVLSWRREGWWKLMEDFGWALRECATHCQDFETILRIDWELMNSRFTAWSGWDYDIHKSLDAFTVPKPKPALVLKMEEVVPYISTSFVFEKSEGNVGEPLKSQLVIQSHGHENSAPVRLSEVKVVFEGNLRPIKIIDEPEASSGNGKPCVVSSLSLRDCSASNASPTGPPAGSLASMVGKANLSLLPGQVKAFNLTSIPREAGEVRMSSIVLLVEEEKFDISYVVTEQSPLNSAWWSPGRSGYVKKRVGKDRDTSCCSILPKPPKVRIATPNSQDQYYTDERVVLDIRINNEEEESVEIFIQMKLHSSSEESATFHWLDDTPTDHHIEDSTNRSPSTENLPAPFQSLTRQVGALARADHTTFSAVLTNTSMPLDYELEINAFYHIVSDVETQLSKSVSLDFSFIKPFEANYELLPRVHPAPWPNFFHVDDPVTDGEMEPEAHGLQQRWSLNSKMISFAQEPLVIEAVSLVSAGVSGGKIRTISAEESEVRGIQTLLPEGSRESTFTIEVQRFAMDDRQATLLNFALDIRWRRRDENTIEPSHSSSSLSSHKDSQSIQKTSMATTTTTTTTLPIPRFVIPMGEPRVLASTTTSSTLPGLIHMSYTLENPSMHFLTFNLTMEASDQFAFSGPKSQAVQLVPLSRHTVRYNLLATGRGNWIQPQLAVVDSYYNKTLRVLPTEGMKADRKGILVWVE